MRLQRGITLVETAIGGAVLLAGALGIASLVNQGLVMMDPSRPSSAYYAPMVECLLRAQCEALKADYTFNPAPTVPFVPNKTDGAGAAGNASMISQQQWDWVSPIHQGNFWFFTQLDRTGGLPLTSTETLQEWTVRVFARPYAAATLAFDEANSATPGATYWLLAETKFWRLVKNAGTNPISQ